MPEKSSSKKALLGKLFPFLLWFPLVNKSSIKDDAMAGLTNAVIVLPQGVAFAMIAGLPPIYGLYTAIVIPIFAALFGSSFHLISGPTTAISIVLFSSLSEFAEPGTASFIELAFIMTFIAGLIQLLMGIARLGSLVNYVSHSVILGFTSGAAILIASSQLKHVLGINFPNGLSFYRTWEFILSHLADTNISELSIALITFLSALLIKKINSKLPHMLLAMIVGSLAAYFISSGIEEVELVGSLASKLPSFHFPELSYSKVIALSPSAFAIALLGLIEAVAIARAIALVSKQKIDGNQEFIGQGISNIMGGMFMCYVGSGSFTRSGINYQSGAKTPMSALFAAISLALILLFIAPLAAHLPIAAMGGIIMIVAYNLIDIPKIIETAKTSKEEFSVLLVTFMATLFLHLEYAIYIGVAFSLIFYLKRKFIN